jgi:hypothetical protein
MIYVGMPIIPFQPSSLLIEPYNGLHQDKVASRLSGAKRLEVIA